jgi:phage baseplate assembly protein W
MATYLGFSTYNRVRKFKLTDFELVRQDLFNHFQIRRGEKLMNPNFGTIIWNVIYEPYTDTLREAIIQDVKNIVSYDPRIAVENINLTELDNGIQLEIDLRYLLTNESNTLSMQFDRDSSTVSLR